MKEFKTLTKKQNKSLLLKERVSERLNNSLDNYYENLENTINYLASRNAVTVLKGIIKKYRKEPGKENE
jgi:F0F1-type ATP synthase delta subunit